MNKSNIEEAFAIAWAALYVFADNKGYEFLAGFAAFSACVSILAATFYGLKGTK